ncbi:hypothetical protein PENTCL1PPCAC_24845, partial [Pristionchus entomophagus]
RLLRSSEAHSLQLTDSFAKEFLRYAYALVCTKTRLITNTEADEFRLFLFSNLFRMLYEENSEERGFICDVLRQKHGELYTRCYVPDSDERLQRFKVRCNSRVPFINFLHVFQRFSVPCSSLDHFISTSPLAISSIGRALAADTAFMNYLSGQLVINVKSDSELPSLVLKTRLLLQHFSLAAVKLYGQMDAINVCLARFQEDHAIIEGFGNSTEPESGDNSTDTSEFGLVGNISLNSCCDGNQVICDMAANGITEGFKELSDEAWHGIYIEGGLLCLVLLMTIFLTFLLIKTSHHLSTATVLFVFNIIFSNVLFLSSFMFLYSDLINDQTYGRVSDDYNEKSANLIVAETLQTHLFGSDQFRRHLVQETLFSLAQNGSLIGLIHLLLLVLVVISRSMTGKSTHLARRSVVAVFAFVWMFLIISHIIFSMMQISAIRNLDELFTVLSTGTARQVACKGNETDPNPVLSDYDAIASLCDKTAVFHALGAYLLRGHTLFTVIFLSVSILIFGSTVFYHHHMKKQNAILQAGLRDNYPHRRREMLFHTLLLSIATFFLSVLGQTYIELAVVWEEDKERVAQLSRWYHVARIAAFIDPVLNPLIVVLRTPLLRKQVVTQISSYANELRSKMGHQWESVRRSRDSSSRGAARKKSRTARSLSVSRMPTSEAEQSSEMSVSLRNNKPVTRLARSLSRVSINTRLINAIV